MFQKAHQVLFNTSSMAMYSCLKFEGKCFFRLCNWGWQRANLGKKTCRNDLYYSIIIYLTWGLPFVSHQTTLLTVFLASCRLLSFIPFFSVFPSKKCINPYFLLFSMPFHVKQWLHAYLLSLYSVIFVFPNGPNVCF